MAQETRSLWEIYDSEVPPWRRGRVILLWIGSFYLLVQALVIGAQGMRGNLPQVVASAAVAVFFWLQFYFIWIGVHWLRWFWGAVNLLIGFALLIWAWHDESASEGLFGSVTFFSGAFLCSPSVYLFAKRQKETVRWIESLAVVAACVLLLCSVFAGGIGLFAYREQQQREACAFADDAAEHIYQTHDGEWASSHVMSKPDDFAAPDRLRYFLLQTTQGLGSIEQIRHAAGIARLRLDPSFGLRSDAHVVSRAETSRGPVALHFLLTTSAQGWQIEHMWWEYLPLEAKNEW